MSQDLKYFLRSTKRLWRGARAPWPCGHAFRLPYAANGRCVSPPVESEAWRQAAAKHPQVQGALAPRQRQVGRWRYLRSLSQVLGLVGVLGLGSVNSTFAEEKVPPGGECFVCHAEDPGMGDWKDDVHALAGLDCTSCHGGNPNTGDMDEAKLKKFGFRGAPKPGEVPMLCGKCHGDASFMKKYNPTLPVDQVEKYWTSVHGKKLRQGDTQVAECVSCHHAHGIRKVNDAKSPVYPSNVPGTCAHCHADAKYMAAYKIPTNQYEEYQKSVHGEALLVKGDVRGAPACNDCHGNHGAQPPGMDTVAHICGSCHTHNAEYFLGSAMGRGFRKKGHLDCAECHGKHLIHKTSEDMINNHPDGLCMKCHKPGDKGEEMALHVSGRFRDVKEHFESAHALLESAHVKGMDIGEGEDAMQAARQALIQARTAVHTFESKPVDEKLDESKKNLETAAAIGRERLQEHNTRRVGLGISTGLLVLLTVSLAVKIRYLSKD